MDLSILSVLILLLISCFTYLFSNKYKLPYTVLLVTVGILLVPLSKTTFFGFIDDFQLTPDVLFFVFLPVLLFESSYNIKYKELIKNWKSISSLAIIGLLISSGLIAVGLFYLFPFIGLNIPFLVCFLFGALISATDPVAVLSIFKSMGAPKRLALIFEGESLFNDGTSLALFTVILGIIYEGGTFSSMTFLNGVLLFSSMLFGGIVFGIIFGILFSKILSFIKNNEEVEIVLTMMVAHITFLSSEIFTHHFPFLPISGVISTVIASIIVGNYGRYKITPRVEAHMQKFWEFFAFVSNSLVFILLGLILSSVNTDVLSLIPVMLFTIPVVMVARLISVYIPIFFLNKFSNEQHVSRQWIDLLSWGSLRGALALMMVLIIPSEGSENYEKILEFQNNIGWDYTFSIKDFLLMLTITSIMFTLFVKAPTISWFMKRMKVDKLNDLECFEYEEGRILSNLKIIEKLNNLHKKAYLTEYEFKQLREKYNSKLQDAIYKMKEILDPKNTNTNGLIKRAISLHALGIEKQYLKNLYLYNEIDEKNFKYILRKIDLQMERLDNNSPQLRSMECSTVDYDIFAKISIWLYRDKHSDINMYIRNRARLVITRKVIRELMELSKINFGFNSKIFDEIIEQYLKFNKKSDIKRVQIFKNNKNIITNLDSNLVNKSLLKLEEEVINDLYSKEIITNKLYLKFKEEIEKELYLDFKIY